MNENFHLSSSLSIRDGFLFCEGVQIKALQDSLSSRFPTHSSPCFVYSQKQILENIEAYLGALKNSGIQCNLGYSMKANYNPEIVRLAGQAGCWAVAVSGFEVMLAIQQGIQPQNIILNGNGKQNWEIETAVKHDCLINVDSTFDLKNIIKISDKLKKKVRVLVRLNPDIDANVHPFLATGMAKSKFGTEDSQLFSLLDAIKNNDSSIELIGLHCHLGSTIDNTHVFSECLDVMINLADKVRQKGFTSLSILNLGGGLGIDYRRHEQRTKKASDPVKPGESVTEDGIKHLIDKVQLSCKEKSDEICQLLSIASGSPDDFHRDKRRQLRELLAEHKEVLHLAKSIIPSLNAQVDMPSPYELIASVQSRLNKTGYHLILEPGRSLVGNAGTFITKVIGVKRNGSQRYVVIDGSMTEVIRPALYGAYHHIELTEPSLFVADRENGKDSFSVVGPVCECGDFLGKDRVLPVPHEECGLAVFDTGAYCSSMASNYNMRPRPVEVMVDGQGWRVIRQPETLENILSSFVQK